MRKSKSGAGTRRKFTRREVALRHALSAEGEENVRLREVLAGTEVRTARAAESLRTERDAARQAEAAAREEASKAKERALSHGAARAAVLEAIAWELGVGGLTPSEDGQFPDAEKVREVLRVYAGRGGSALKSIEKAAGALLGARVELKPVDLKDPRSLPEYVEEATEAVCREVVVLRDARRRLESDLRRVREAAAWTSNLLASAWRLSSLNGIYPDRIHWRRRVACLAFLSAIAGGEEPLGAIGSYLGPIDADDLAYLWDEYSAVPVDAKPLVERALRIAASIPSAPAPRDTEASMRGNTEERTFRIRTPDAMRSEESPPK